VSLRPPDQDELLTSAGMPRWVRWLVAVGAVGLLVTLGVVKATTHAPTASTSPGPTMATPTPGAASSAPVFRPVSVPVAGARRIPLPADAPPTDVLSDSGTTWVLQGRMLSTRTAAGGWRSVLIGAGPPAPGQTALVLDRTEPRLWVVDIGTPHSTVRAFDARTLHPAGAFSWPHQILSTAALRGALYDADYHDVTRLEADGSATPISLPRGQQVVDIVADPVRVRTLLLIATKSPGMLVSELGANGPVTTVAAPYTLGKGFLGVTGSGQVWVAGFGSSGAVLARLDPATLQTAAVSPLTNQLGPGALLLAAGSRSLLIGRGDGGSGLWCVDDLAGAPVQRWAMQPVQATSSSGLAYVIANGQLVRLRISGRCIG
jgi:hypothetical protein